jgi:hypothetical protein
VIGSIENIIITSNTIENWSVALILHRVGCLYTYYLNKDI